MMTGKRNIRAGGRNKQIWSGVLMHPHALTNFEIQKSYPSKSKFNGLHSGNNLPKLKDGTYVINLDEYKSIGTYQIALYVDGDNVTYYDSFEAEQIEKKFKILSATKTLKQIFIGNK